MGIIIFGLVFQLLNLLERILGVELISVNLVWPQLNLARQNDNRNKNEGMNGNPFNSRFVVIFTAIAFLTTTPFAFCQDTNAIISIQFDDIPITSAIDNLARQSHHNYILDPRISGMYRNRTGKVISEPILKFRWENLTPSKH
jgi:hypothetical protein